MKIDGCTALITGASAGIGREFARQLAARAGKLVLVARRAERLTQLRDELTKLHPRLVVHVRVADWTAREQLSGLCDWLKLERIEVDLLINNAGLGDHGEFATSEERRIDAMLDLNTHALTSLTYRLLPAMIARRTGGILNVSSSAGFLPIPRMAVYSATKAYVNSFTEALRIELLATGIHVSAVCPGPVATEFNAVAKRPNESAETAPSFTYVPVETVVQEAVVSLELNRPFVVPGTLMKLAMLLVRVTPLPLLRWAARRAR